MSCLVCFEFQAGFSLLDETRDNAIYILISGAVAFRRTFGNVNASLYLPGQSCHC